MTFETAIPPEVRRFDPRPGYWKCGFCPAHFQSPLYDENGDFYQDEPAATVNVYAHNAICTPEANYLNDPNAFYPSDANEPEPKCYTPTECFY